MFSIIWKWKLWSYLDETRLVFWSMGKTATKVGPVGCQNKNKIIWFSVSVFYLNNILHGMSRRKTCNLYFIIIMINGSCFWLFIWVFYVLFLIFFRKQKRTDNKKASLPKFWNIIFLLLLKIGLVVPVDQQIDLISPHNRMWYLIKYHRYHILCLRIMQNSK